MDTLQTPAQSHDLPTVIEHAPTGAEQTVSEPVTDGAQAAESVSGGPAGETETPAPTVVASAAPEASTSTAVSAQDPGAVARNEEKEALAEGDGDPLGEAAPFDPAVFDEALSRVLSSAGGEVLFRFAGEVSEGDKIAAVRLGEGEARLIALVILPPNGAPLRVEPVEDSANPLAPLAKSYASLVDAWKAAA